MYVCVCTYVCVSLVCVSVSHCVLFCMFSLLFICCCQLNYSQVFKRRQELLVYAACLMWLVVVAAAIAVLFCGLSAACFNEFSCSFWGY